MKRGVPPWSFFKRNLLETVIDFFRRVIGLSKRRGKYPMLKIFLFEGYNAIAYYLLGVGIALLVCHRP